ncbi:MULTISPECIES: hypothetical protein [unclassified Neisseria]|uniref:hypothetical protein n=1 Tax=unclassified Neisseria TaxID=2623750 RepID=UPI001072C84D|nr:MULTISPECIES: hypothetical protein [unclassified Neisseria]MBF0803367.1 hypothetical protein [Neisseria sp. 19428wB4_WF04]TFU44027.1 hypothetical protein E4T99_03195 [Neisseria sp. WF04]
MNLFEQFNAIFNREQRGIAKITGDLGGGSFAARAHGGGNIVLSGQAANGQSVFYDKRTNKIIGQAPDLQITDIPV